MWLFGKVKETHNRELLMAGHEKGSDDVLDLGTLLFCYNFEFSADVSVLLVIQFFNTIFQFCERFFIGLSGRYGLGCVE